MVLGFRVSYYGGADDSTGRSAASSRAPMCPCSNCWEGLPHGTKAMNSWRKKKTQQKKQNDSPSSSTSSLASTLSEKPAANKKKTLASRLTRRPSTESFASDMVPLRATMSFQSTAETLMSSSDRDSFLDEKI